MLIGLLGATGRTGQAILAQGLARGTRFRCLVRDPRRLADLIDRVEVMEGDAIDDSLVSRLTHRCDAVISVIGHRRGSPPDLLTHSVRNVLISRPARFVLLTVAAVDLAGDRKSPLEEIGASGMRLFRRRIVRDSQDAADLVRASPGDCVIVRTPAISDSPPRGAWRVSFTRLPSNRPISRQDVAAFLLNTAGEAEHPGPSPFIAY